MDHGGVRILKYIVGVGFWVQGLRCLPWMAISYFLKDGLNVSPSSIQILQTSANLPMVAKPIYGLLSDAIYIRGQHRLPYVAIGALLQAVSWLLIALLPESTMSFIILTFFLLLSNLGASVAEVANDAIVAEANPNLQSFGAIFGSSGGVIGNLLGGIAISRFAPRTIFLLFGLILLLQFLTTIIVPESSLRLPKNTKQSSMRKQLSELSSALKNPDISRSIAWFFASYAVVPVLTGTMFFYQTQHLKLESSVIGFSKVFGQAGLMMWSIAFNKKFKKTSVRKLLSIIQATIAVLMVSDVFFVKGTYREMGVSDSVYVITFSGFLEALFLFKVLPFSVLLAQLCPAGCEGSLMAFLMSALALSIIIGGYLGVALAGIVGVSGENFSGLTIGILIQALFTVLPLGWVSWIPEIGELEIKKE